MQSHGNYLGFWCVAVADIVPVAWVLSVHVLNYLSMGFFSFGVDSKTVWTRWEKGDSENLLEYSEPE